MIQIRKYCTFMFLIVTIGLVLCLSSCSKTAKTNADGDYQGKNYLENKGDGVCQQHPSELMWQAGKSPNFSSWEDANQYVESLKLGGFEDWRLPTAQECLRLSQLIQMKKSNCPLETSRYHWVMKSKNVESGTWESSVYCDGPEFRWTQAKKGTVKAVRP